MRPGVDVISLNQPPPRSAPTYTGVWFVVGETATGPEEPIQVRSMRAYEDTFGARSGGPLLYDSAEAYFREGGSVLFVSAIPTTPGLLMARVVDTGDTGEAMEQAAESKAEQKEAGALPRTHAELDALAAERGVELADEATVAEKQAALEGAGVSGQSVGINPLAATDLQITDALARFGASLGPGQVSVPGKTTSTVHAALLDHASKTNRVALLDGLETGDAAAQKALATALIANPAARYGAIFGPWSRVPGVAAGTERHVPFSAIEAGMIGRNDGLNNPNVAAAGANGVSSFSIGLTELYSDVDYADLNEGGFNSARMIYGDVEAYGYRTLVDPDGSAASWLSLGWARLNMSIVAHAEAIGENYVFAQIDGRGLAISQFGAELRAMLLPYWQEGSLYGATPSDAFDVDVGEQVNTEETIANGELHAVIRVRMSPFSEWVVIEIVKVATSEPVSVAA